MSKQKEKVILSQGKSEDPMAHSSKKQKLSS